MELNFLFGNPVKGKKGGKGMATKKRPRKAVKRRSSARKNPISGWNTKTGNRMQFFTDSEISGIQKRGKELADALTQAMPSRYSAPEKALIASLSHQIYSPAKAVSKKTVDSLVKKIDADYKLVDGSAKSALTKVKKRLESILKLQEGAKLSAADKKFLGQVTKDVSSKRSKAAMKKYSLKYVDDSQPDIDTSKLTIDDLRQIAANMKSGNPSKGGKKMAKAKAKKAKGKKAAKRKVARKAGKKVARKAKSKIVRKTARKGKSRRKAKSLPLTESSLKKMLAGEKAARKYLKGHKKAKTGPKKGRKVSLKWKRSNPGVDMSSFVGVAKSAAPYLAYGAGAAAIVAGLGWALKKAPLPAAVKDFMAKKYGPVTVGPLLLSAAAAAVAYTVSKRSKGAMAEHAEKVALAALMIPLANIGVSLVQAGMARAGLAGVEPTLMGVEPLLMGEADFGEADFGEADFGAIEQFSGVEPVLMGEADFGQADFGAIQQYGAIEQFSGYGAIEQFSGDEDYAGEEDFGEDDMDGEHLG